LESEIILSKLGIDNSLDRIFLINKSYAGCAQDFGWFVIADKYLACGWERKGTKPVFLYTKNRTSRNWKTSKFIDIDLKIKFLTINQ
jgi:hypothetical protein